MESILDGQSSLETTLSEWLFFNGDDIVLRGCHNTFMHLPAVTDGGDKDLFNVSEVVHHVVPNSKAWVYT